MYLLMKKFRLALVCGRMKNVYALSYGYRYVQLAELAFLQLRLKTEEDDELLAWLLNIRTDT